jgi:acyl transferase domain-containing protein/NAD(P)-dependent dehydrogenase (short-subunit alcohol dehydrogenase family)
MSTSKPAPASGQELAFLFPGQGSYDASFLHGLYTGAPETVPAFVQADAAARRLLGEPFLPLVTAETPERRQELAAASPDLQQLGIFLAGLLTAHLLERRGVRPDLLVGHSFGEIAALGAAEVFDPAAGVEIVCHRVLALRAARTEGSMAALSCAPGRVEELLRKLGRPAVEIAVLNHPRQTVVSGPRGDLEALAPLAAAHGVSLTFVKSLYPFHSSHLAAAVDRFAASLRAYDFAPARVPVYLAMEGRLYARELDLPVLLASQLTRRLDFAGAVRSLQAAGYRRFIEMGCGDMVSKLVLKNFAASATAAAAAEVSAQPAVQPGEEIRPGLERTAQLAAPSPALLHAELAQLLREATERLDRAAQLLRRIEPAAHALPAEPEAAETAPETAPEPCPQMPIAVVAMGCVLPGAADADEFWRHVLEGVSGIVDLAELDPDLGRDFVAGRGGGEIEIVPDKSYTMLSGAIRQVAYDAPRLAGFYDAPAFAALTRGQQLLACALGQALAALPGGARTVAAGKLQCILGATADGSSEYDEALFLESVRGVAAELPVPEERRAAFLARLDRLPSLRSGDSEALRQHELYRSVAGRLLGDGVRTYVVDAACSSSLYSIDLGLKALREGAADLVVAGGVFAPGPANNALFAQFRGLTPSASRPLDVAADGVVFGDGAATVVLKRLPDALEAGDTVLGVIRGMGLSSDGKSPAVNVPQSAGQSLAIRRAYAASGIPLDSVQLIEAHATATPVGDAVEVRALSDVFSERQSDRPRIQLGSVKSLIGHTGWVSGVASLIKILQAFAHRTIPPQHNFTEPAPGLALASKPFEISREARPWPDNLAPFPRRAGINGFGFGGTNAHLVVEAFDESYHRRLCRAAALQPRPSELVVVGVASLFPAADELAGAAPSPARQFQRSALRLPPGKLLLPDVTDHMDASQYLTALAAGQILSQLPKTWQELREATGVVIGLEGKTERGVRANERIFLDRLRRVTAGQGADAARDEVLAALTARLAERNLPSGPYTLSGLMPNVAASRVSSLYDLKGPNLVIDMGEGSLFQALAAAAGLLAHGDCRMVLAGGLNATGRKPESDAEAILMLALTTPETARALGLPELATVQVAAPGEAVAEPAVAADGAAGGRRWRGATGAVEILEGLRQRRLLLAPPALTLKAAAPRVAAPAAPPKAAAPEPPATHAYVQGTPIETYGPVLVAAPAIAPAATFAGRRLLVLTDQPALWPGLAAAGSLAGAAYTLVCPADAAAAGAVAVDLSSDEGLAASIGALDGLDFDTILAVRTLTPHDARSLLTGPLERETRLLDLLFAVCRHAYPALSRGAAALYTLCLDAFEDGRPHPYTGLLGGFVKSLARELPAAAIRSVHTDAPPRRAWQQLALDMGQPPGAAEVCWRGDRREVFALQPVAELAVDSRPYLSADSVVLATGGARGVTAVMAEELQHRFGCTVIAVGRTDAGRIPDALAAMTEDELAAFEGTFYREELARDPSQKITELKRRFADYQAVHELRRTIRRLEQLPGRFAYQRVDLGDEAAVAELVGSIYARYGRLDLVVHGAGIQISKTLPKKSLADFRRIVGTKLGGLSAIDRASRRHAAGAPVHFHLLSSAFSYLGNDGQPDYGAANEAMNRLAEALNGRDGGAVWSSLAWLGWAGIGMTRGSEFAALAASRRLRGVTHDEGRDIFGRLMAGRPSAPATVLLAAGEREFYRPALVEARPVRPVRPALQSSLVIPLEINLDNAPYLRDHLVHGVPTLPGAFLIGIAADAAHRLRPDMRILAFENTSFRRFVRVYEGRSTEIRLDTRVVEEGDAETIIRVQVLSDFVHKSGAVLQKDVVQTEIFIRMAESQPSVPLNGASGEVRGGLQLPDPYLLESSPVRLNGRFKSLRSLQVNGDRRQAHYQLGNSSYPESPLQHLLPNVIMVDAFWRFGTIMATGERALSVYVPERCEKMGVYFDYTDFSLDWLNEPLVFTGANPRPQGDQLLVGPIEVRDREGRLRLTVEGGVCRKFGEIQDAF